jgi:hypothetical protein
MSEAAGHLTDGDRNQKQGDSVPERRPGRLAMYRPVVKRRSGAL